MNRIDKLFVERENLLSIYYTAGFPNLEDTRVILEALDEAPVDMVEIGMPFSDPLADGPVIQKSSLRALENGITVKKILEQLKGMRPNIQMPVLLMGYINPILRYGVRDFARDCYIAGVDGLIIPDLPFDEYLKNYKDIFDDAQLRFIPLIAPQVSDERIRYIDENAEGFIYMVASAGITGNIKTTEEYRTRYFERVKGLLRHNKCMIGFGVKDAAGFEHACRHARGAIIGTAFINHLESRGTSKEAVREFVRSIKPLP